MKPDLEALIGLLSDGPLFEEATAFAAKEDFTEQDLRASQINGLLVFSHGAWSELEEYVRHQGGRNWPSRRDGSEHPTKRFYTALRSKLTWLRQQSQAWGLVPPNLSQSEARHRTNAVVARLAEEFIQHLAAEILFRRKGP